VSLQGKVAIVTGSAQGIGRATAWRLAHEGVAVVGADIQDEKGQAEAAAIHASGARASFVRADVGDPSEIEAMVGHAVETYGRLDIVVNNAFASTCGTAEEVDGAAWDRGFAVMVRAMSLTARAAVPHLRAAGGGSIINISSVHGLLAAARSVIYEACKHAVIGITRAMAIDFGPDRIRVNAICPGFICTEQHNPRWVSDHARAVADEEMYPLRRVGRPHDIAAAIRFLVSDEAAFITGHALAVDGGLSIQLQDGLAARVRAHVESGDRDRPLHTPALLR